MKQLTHINERGEAHMVDIHEKEVTHRTARAVGEIRMNEEAFRAVQEGSAKKGDVLGVARVAGIMAAKKCADLIPLCHNISLANCSVDFMLDEEQHSVRVECSTSCTGKTGVEMEALTGASVALLAVYDMCKAVDRGMVITEVRLLEKDGGRSGHYVMPTGA